MDGLNARIGRRLECGRSGNGVGVGCMIISALIGPAYLGSGALNLLAFLRIANICAPAEFEFCLPYI